VLIAESHLAIHTWPERGVLWADVFSCKPFDSKIVVGALVKAFGIGHCKVQIIERDLEEVAYLQVEG
jgi:S-adenosylmethionine decarboxylase